jgi:alpha-beta hydrolase superfamily lysophospholipase
MYCNSNNAGLLGQIVSENTGMNVYGLDFINAGKSQSDEPGYYKSVDHLVEQAHAFIQVVLSRFENEPKVFISGVSMGGLVSFNLGVKYPKIIDGIIFLAPALR